MPVVQRNVPVRTFAEWDNPQSGDMEADLVSRDGALVVAALEQLGKTMPFPLRGFDTDNGGEFLNDTVATYCRAHDIPCTRSRPYHKNDQAWVEQKNGSVVRRLVGYRRLEGLAAAAALARLYTAARLFVNFFQPSFKLASKTRVGAKVSKAYHTPATPYAQRMPWPTVSDATTERVRAVAEQLDPLRLLAEIRSVQHHLVSLAAGQPTHVAPPREGDRDGFLASLATAWQHGDVRATHRTAPRAARDWRTRNDPCARVWPSVRTCRRSSPANSQMGNGAPSSAESVSGDTAPRVPSCSRARPPMRRSHVLLVRSHWR